MKRLVILGLVLTAFAANAQNVPNGSFEDWINKSYNVLADWYTVGDVEFVTDATDGQQAVKLSNSKFGGPEGDLFGMVTNINILGGFDFSQGTPYTDMPLSVKVDAKYDLAVGDVAGVQVIFTASGNPIGTAQLQIEGNSNDTFTHFSIPVQWAVSTTPEKIIVLLSSRDLNADSTAGEGSIIFDNFRLMSFSQENDTVPNPSFERMDQELIEHPNGWFTTDMYFFDFIGSRLDPVSAARSDIRKEGGNALLLKNSKMMGGDLVPGVAFYSDAFLNFESPGFPVNKRWMYLEGWYKYTADDDTANVRIGMFNGGQYIGGSENLIYKDNSTEWRYFAFPIAYANGDVPDSAQVVLSSANLDGPSGTNAEFLVDEVAFVDAASVEKRLLGAIRIAPNPVNNVLTLSLERALNGEVIVTDIAGRVIRTMEISGEKEMAISMKGQIAGVYFLKIKTQSGQQTIKFIKQ